VELREEHTQPFTYTVSVVLDPVDYVLRNRCKIPYD
jgi:hypothetical protein